MSNEFNNQEWLKEYSDFMASSPVQPPLRLGESLRSHVQKDLNPNPWSVFSKLALVQIFVGFATLLFCPQFGYTPTGVHGIMHVFMQFGNTVCMAACGAIFVGSSLLTAALVLKSPEVRVLRSHRVLQTTLISIMAVGTFLCLGAEVMELVTLAWIVGSVIGGLSSLEIGWQLRQLIRLRVVYG